MRTMFVLAILFIAGCSKSILGPANHDLKPMAAAAQAAALALTTASPLVTPVQPGGVCPNCNGRGKVGDGVVMVTCQACGGTGRSTTDTALQEIEAAKREIERLKNAAKNPPPYKVRDRYGRTSWFVVRNDRTWQWNGSKWVSCDGNACETLPAADPGGVGATGP